MLTTLLASRKQVEVKRIGAKPLIEVIGEESTTSTEEGLSQEDMNGDGVFEVDERRFDWTEHGATSCCSNDVRIYIM